MHTPANVQKLNPPLSPSCSPTLWPLTCAVRGWSLKMRRSLTYSIWPDMPLSRSAGMISAVMMSMTWVEEAQWLG